MCVDVDLMRLGAGSVCVEGWGGWSRTYPRAQPPTIVFTPSNGSLVDIPGY